MNFKFIRIWFTFMSEADHLKNICAIFISCLVNRLLMSFTHFFL